MTKHLKTMPVPTQSENANIHYEKTLAAARKYMNNPCYKSFDAVAHAISKGSVCYLYATIVDSCRLCPMNHAWGSVDRIDCLIKHNWWVGKILNHQEYHLREAEIILAMTKLIAVLERLFQ